MRFFRRLAQLAENPSLDNLVASAKAMEQELEGHARRVAASLNTQALDAAERHGFDRDQLVHAQAQAAATADALSRSAQAMSDSAAAMGDAAAERVAAELTVRGVETSAADVKRAAVVVGCAVVAAGAVDALLEVGADSAAGGIDALADRPDISLSQNGTVVAGSDVVYASAGDVSVRLG